MPRPAATYEVSMGVDLGSSEEESDGDSEGDSILVGISAVLYRADSIINKVDGGIGGPAGPGKSNEGDWGPDDLPPDHYLQPPPSRVPAQKSGVAGAASSGHALLASMQEPLAVVPGRQDVSMSEPEPSLDPILDQWLLELGLAEAQCRRNMATEGICWDSFELLRYWQHALQHAWEMKCCYARV